MSKYSNFVNVGKKIIGVGKNYKTIGNLPTEPLIFMKPPSAYITEGQDIKVPRECKILNEEVELGVLIGKTGVDILEKDAMDYVAGYLVVLDMTAKDFLENARKDGLPWLLAKGFDTGCPVSKFIDKSRVPNPDDLNLWCKINGEIRQTGNTKDLIFKIPFLLRYISSYFTLSPCDLILTGTPPDPVIVNPGDKIECGIDQLISMTFNVKSK